MRKDIVCIRDAIPVLHANIVNQQYLVVMHWLSPTDFAAQQHDVISRRQEDTGQWFLDSKDLRKWLHGVNLTLFCPGIPGAGKTMMAAIAIDYLSRTAQADIGLGYLFCNYKSQVDQSLSSLLSTLLKQLAQSRPDFAASVIRLYDDHSKRFSRPSIDELSKALQDVCSNYTRVYIVVDALDECSNQEGTRSQIVEKLRNLQLKTNARLLFTSRFIPEIEEIFRSNPMLEVRASNEDVTRFVIGQWSRLPRYDEQLKRTILKRIVQAADGM
jgi:hypothetical protein